MAYDEGTAERLRDPFAGRFDVSEKRMFGGIADDREGGQRMALATAVTNARSTRCASGSCPRRQVAADL